MTITGQQIREARAFLGLKRHELAARTKLLTTSTIVRAESVDGEPPIAPEQIDTIRQTLEQAGIEFTEETPGVRWRNMQPKAMITAAQIREARRLLRRSSATLAMKAGVGFSIVLKAQLDAGIGSVDTLALRAIAGALTRSGVRFTADGGVSLRRPKPPSSASVALAHFAWIMRREPCGAGADRVLLVRSFGA